MGDLNASALHLISAIINAPRFHREINSCPNELTERCVHLLTTLGRNREVAIRANYEMVEFFTNTLVPFDDPGYMRVSRHFVHLLLTVIGPQHKIWGAISFVMLSVTPLIEEEQDLSVWRRLNARFFEVLLDSGVITSEEEQKLKLQSTANDHELPEQHDPSFDNLLHVSTHSPSQQQEKQMSRQDKPQHLDSSEPSPNVTTIQEVSDNSSSNILPVDRALPAGTLSTQGPELLSDQPSEQKPTQAVDQTLAQASDQSSDQNPDVSLKEASSHIDEDKVVVSESSEQVAPDQAKTHTEPSSDEQTSTPLSATIVGRNVRVTEIKSAFGKS